MPKEIEMKRIGRTGRWLTGAATIAAIALLPATANAIVVNNPFNADAQNWQVAGDNTCFNAALHPPVWESTGGNPGGNISGTDGDSEECFWSFYAPIASGQNRLANYGGTLSVDVRHSTTADRNITIYIVDGDGNALANDSASPPAANTWTTFAVPLSETSPGNPWSYQADGAESFVAATQANFFEVLQNVQYFSVLGDLSSAITGGTTRLDNFVLTEGPPADNDGDGVANGSDSCPLQAGPSSNNGCPLPDSDGDGVPDPSDQCPSEAGPAPTGCPPANPDPDGDGLIGAVDKCPDQAGPASNDGCPAGTDPPGSDGAACDAAKKKLEKAKAKLKKLKESDAKASKIKKAKAKVKKAKNAVKEAC
jgi:hypothetical protein